MAVQDTQRACAVCRASASDSMLFSGVLEGRGSEVAKWLQSPGFESQLFSFFPCSDPPSPVASPMRVCHPHTTQLEKGLYSQSPADNF